MKKFMVLAYCILIGMLISMLSLSPSFAVTEQRKAMQGDIEWGKATDNNTSPGGKFGYKIPRYFDNNAFTDNLTLYGKGVTGDNTGRLQGFSFGSASYTDNGYFGNITGRGLTVQEGYQAYLKGTGNQLGPDGGVWQRDPDGANDQGWNGHYIRTNQGGNVLTIQQMNANSFSAIRAIDNNGYEHTAWGYGNDNGSSLFGQSAFWEHFNNNNVHDNAAQFQRGRIVKTIHAGYQATDPYFGGSADHTNFGYTQTEWRADGTIDFYSLQKILNTYGSGGVLAVNIGDNVSIGAPMQFHNLAPSGMANGVINNNSPVYPIMTGHMLFTSGTSQGYPILNLKSSGYADNVDQQALMMRTVDDSGYFSVDMSLMGSTTPGLRRVRIQTHNQGGSDNGVISMQPTGGRVGIGTATPGSILSVVGLPAHANNAAATGAGLVAGDLYRTGGDPDLVCVVH